MYSLQRLYITPSRELAFSLWDYENTVGYEIRVITENPENKYYYCMQFLSKTHTITFWDNLIRSIKNLPFIYRDY